jgi:hypothetical protein
VIDPGETLIAGAFWTIAIALTAAADDPAEPAALAAKPVPCLERPGVVAYLHGFQDSVMSHWVIAEDTLSDQAVVARFRITADGHLSGFELASWTNRRLANSVELAFAHTPPIGPVPELATCVVGRSIEMRFENPY